MLMAKHAIGFDSVCRYTGDEQMYEQLEYIKQLLKIRNSIVPFTPEEKAGIAQRIDNLIATRMEQLNVQKSDYEVMRENQERIF